MNVREMQDKKIVALKSPICNAYLVNREIEIIFFIYDCVRENKYMQKEPADLFKSILCYYYSSILFSNLTHFIVL